MAHALTFLCLLAVVFYLSGRLEGFNEAAQKYQEDPTKQPELATCDKNLCPKMVLALTCCGESCIDDVTASVKSAVIFTHLPFHVIVFVDNQSAKAIQDSLSVVLPSRVTFQLQSVSFPDPKNEERWRKLFKPCASQRLFFPQLLADHDAVLYVDTDVILLSPLEDIWAFFKTMNASQLAAAAPETEDPAAGWYNRFARHPYYGEVGVNSGVMLMNLTRMRTLSWGQYLGPFLDLYGKNLTWGDQDIINIIFHYHPDKLLVLPCRWNYRPDHCMYMSNCRSAEDHGVAVLHGSRGAFHGDKEIEVFSTMYNIIKDHPTESVDVRDLRDKLEQGLEHGNAGGTCFKIRNLLIKNIQHATP